MKDEVEQFGEYEVLCEIGSGGYGQIYAVAKENDQKAYVLKIIKEKKSDDIECLNNEIQTLNELNEQPQNPYIPIIYDNQVSQTNPYLTIDFFSQENLYYYLDEDSNPNGLTEIQAKIIFKKIVEGIQFCHSRNICHLDIKPCNIMFDNKFNPIIIDYGLSRKFKDPKTNEIIVFEGAAGTNEYKSPEMFEKQEFTGVESDIFSLGIVLFNLVTGKAGFITSEKEDKYYNLIRNVEDNDYTPYWNKVLPLINKVLPENFKKLYISMVAHNAKNRPTIADILSSDWLKEINILNQQQYDLLENKIRNELEDLYKNIKETNGEEVTIADILHENGYITRGITNNEEKFFKNSELKPKKIPNDRLNVNHCIKINGKLKVVEFMNSLADEIILKYPDNNYIEASEENLKMNVIIDNDKSEENKGKKESKMDIELFEYDKGGYLLEFIRKGGEIPDYYKHFIEIKKIIINELLNINKV